MIILGIDPGPRKSGIAAYDTEREMPIRGSYHHLANDDLLELLWAMPWKTGILAMAETVPLAIRLQFWDGPPPDTMAFEMPQFFGEFLGQDTLEMALMAGRFVEAWIQATNTPAYRVYPTEVATHFCGRTGKGITKAVVQNAIMSRWAVEGNRGKGLKKNPGPLYGISNHSKSALGVAVTKAEGGAGDFPCPFETATDVDDKREPPLFTDEEREAIEQEHLARAEAMEFYD